MAKVILEVQTRGLNQYHTLERFPVTVGRSLDNDVILSDTSISPHHLSIETDAEGALYLHNLSSENGTNMNGHSLGAQPVRLPVPSRLILGSQRVNLLAVDSPVAATNLLKFSGFFSFIANPIWAVLLFLLTAASLFADTYFSTFVAKGAWFYISDVLISLAVLLVFIFALSLVTWLVSHRWALVSAIGMASLLALLKSGLGVAGHSMAYFLTSDAPLGFFLTFYNTVLVTGLLYLYQRWASYLRPLPALGVALLLSSPVLILEGLDWMDQATVNSEFSSEPAYNQTLSSINIHASSTKSLEDFMKDVVENLPSQVETVESSPR